MNPLLLARWIALGGFFIVSVAAASDQSSTYPSGRLFTKPDQRRALDAARSGASDQLRDFSTLGQPGSTSAREGGAGEIVARERVEFSGYVLRHDGYRMVWLDGRSELTEGPHLSDLSCRLVPAERMAILGTATHHAAVKPGQIWLIEKNAVHEYSEPDGR